MVQARGVTQAEKQNIYPRFVLSGFDQLEQLLVNICVIMIITPFNNQFYIQKNIGTDREKESTVGSSTPIKQHQIGQTHK